MSGTRVLKRHRLSDIGRKMDQSAIRTRFVGHAQQGLLALPYLIFEMSQNSCQCVQISKEVHRRCPIDGVVCSVVRSSGEDSLGAS